MLIFLPFYRNSILTSPKVFIIPFSFLYLNMLQNYAFYRQNYYFCRKLTRKSYDTFYDWLWKSIHSAPR